MEQGQIDHGTSPSDHVEHPEQLLLLEVAPAAKVHVPSDHRPDWVLDARTRRLGKEGIAKVREALRRAHPPEPRRHAA
jgi:hypothetical protein